MTKNKQTRRKNPLWKIILADLAGVIALLLVPIIGPLPGPGGIPLLVAGFGFFAINHDWADNAVHYIHKHSESLRGVIFPDIPWVMWLWDGVAVFLLLSGTIMNFLVHWWFFEIVSIVVMASSTTLFMLNRNRIAWLDRILRRTGQK